MATTLQQEKPVSSPAAAPAPATTTTVQSVYPAKASENRWLGLRGNGLINAITWVLLNQELGMQECNADCLASSYSATATMGFLLFGQSSYV